MARVQAKPYSTDRRCLYVRKIAILKAITDLWPLEKMFTLEFEDRSPLGHLAGH